MILRWPPGAAVSKPAPVPLRGASPSYRKVGMCGSHTASLKDAPWDDPSWEWWGHASSRTWYARPMDRYFDLHPKACWTRAGRKDSKGGPYMRWLRTNTIPIYMQERHDEVPASIRYPLRQVLLEFSNVRPYFANHLAYMIALALMEGVQAIGLFGISYTVQSEYVVQRGSAEFWLGLAAGRGVRLMLPELCTLLREPATLYGYQSHDLVTGETLAEYKQKTWKAAQTIKPLQPGETPKRAEPPGWLKEDIVFEEREYARPDWALGPLPDKPNGGAEANG